MIQRAAGAVLPIRTKTPPATAESEATRALVSIAESLREILQVLRDERPKKTVLSERQAVTWLLEWVQCGREEDFPSLSEVARRTGVPRRQLNADRWPKFRDLYDRLKGMQNGVDTSRMVGHHEDEEYDDT